jgi:TonB family protein
MKNTILLLAIVLISAMGYGQKEEPVLTFVQEMPTYAAGDEAFWQLIVDRVVYPEYEKSMNIEGTVFVNFVVERDGTPTHFKINRGVEGGAGLDSVAINACRALGKFNPGTQAGVPQRVYLTIPIKFSLEDDDGPERLSKADLKQIKKDGKYMCDMILKIMEAKRSGDERKSESLSDEFEKQAVTIKKNYPKGGLKEKELEMLVKPCLEEAMKDALGK